MRRIAFQLIARCTPNDGASSTGTGNWNCEWPSTHTMTGIPGGTVIAPESTANFLARCARAHDRFFYPCNAKHREPQSCTYVFRSSGVAEVFEVRVAECTYSEGGTGWRVWPCALLLSCWLAAERRELQLPTLRVLELGCGLGLPGLTAAALGAAQSVLSDCLPILLRTVAESVRCVHVGAGDTRTGSRRTRVALLDWDEEAPGCADAAEIYSTEQAIKQQQLQGLAVDAAGITRDDVEEPLYERRLARSERFGLLLASDVVYSRQHAEQLARVVAARLAWPPADSRPAEARPDVRPGEMPGEARASETPAVGPSEPQGGRLAAMVPVRSEEHTRCFLCGLIARGLLVRVSRVDREWVEGVTATQLEAEFDGAEWTRCTARNGRPFWHNARLQASIWTDPNKAAAWRHAATDFAADAPLVEGEILFVDARVVAHPKLDESTHG